MPLRTVTAVLSVLVILTAPAAAQCTLVGSAHDLGPGCLVSGGPVVSLFPALNSVAVTIQSQPHAMGELYASVGTAPPFLIGSCNVYIDLAHMVYAQRFMTDPQGVFTLTGSLPNDPSLDGMSICVQASVWLMGPPASDVASNGACLTLQCVSGGGQGCTPGYWKQTQHFDSWPSAYSPDQLFSSVFSDAFPGMTLLEVLSNGGGGLNALGRHAVAALLDSARLSGGYGLTTSMVISMFNTVFAGPSSQYETVKDFFESLNQQGCPLN